VARAEAYLHAEFHLDPSNRLATVHERHRQNRQTDRQDRQRTDSIGRTDLQTVSQKVKEHNIIATIKPYVKKYKTTQHKNKEELMHQVETWLKSGLRRHIIEEATVNKSKL